MKEMSMIQKIQTWVRSWFQDLMTEISKGVKWVFCTKLNVKGYSQTFGVDYTDTFAPAPRLDRVRLLLVIVAQNG